MLFVCAGLWRSAASNKGQGPKAQPTGHGADGRHRDVRLVHVPNAGVLRNAARARDAGTLPAPALPAVPPADPDAATLDALATATSHPTWMVARWVRRYGTAEAFALLQANNRCPLPVTGKPNTKCSTAKQVVQRPGASHACCFPAAGGAMQCDRLKNL